jgi:dUTP pyrophosphatase
MKTPMLRVQLLAKGAKLPECAHPGEDLAYDIFALEQVSLLPNITAKVKTGIAVELEGYGFLMKDRSSIASAGVHISGGVIDAGYRGELQVIMTNMGRVSYIIAAGAKIAQLVPLKPFTVFPVKEVSGFSPTVRGTNGFGSTGR